MPQPQTQSNVQKNGRLLSGKAKQPRGIHRKQLLRPVRKSARLHWKSESKDERPERTYPLPSPSASNTPSEDLSQHSSAVVKSSNPHRKRKRSQQPNQDSKPRAIEDPFSHDSNEPSPKRPRTGPEARSTEGASKPQAVSNASDSNADPIDHWIRQGRWPKKYFEQNGKMIPSLSRKRSLSSCDEESAPSGAISREGKSADYRDRLYESRLATAGIYMDNSWITIMDACKTLCQTMLNEEQAIPEISLFQDDIFDMTCARLRNENEAMVVRDASPLIVPPAEILYAYGAKTLEHLMGHVNQQWYGCVPLVVPGKPPQPDYAVGFKKTAFSQDQNRKLDAFIQGWKGTPFLATASMYFPFLTCEVKCGNEALDIADRQNIHSGSVAVKQLVDLYKAVSREAELHQKILAFSISHNHEFVKIYGHYARVEKDTIIFCRYPIHIFGFTTMEGKEKWTAYRFTRNVYDIFMPIHLRRICSAIDQLSLDLKPPESGLESSQQSEAEPVSQLEEDNCQSSIVGSHRRHNSQEPPAFKKPRLTANGMLKEQNDELLKQRQEMKQESDRQKQESDLLKQESSRQKQEMKQENDELKEQFKELMNMLKQRFA